MTTPHAIADTPASERERGEHRMLRVGIIHGRRIVEERVLARPGDVTIGTSPRSTFIVPWDDAPVRWRLFEERGGRRFLHLAADMTARIADGAAVTSIDGRGAGAPARPIPLSDRARGKVTVGDTTVLFQLLRPPAPHPRPQLPISVRHRVTDGIDRFFTAVVAFTLLLHVAVVVYLRQVDWPRRPDIEAIPDRFVRQNIHMPRPAPPRPETVTAEHTPTPTPRPRPPSAPTQPSERPPGKPRPEVDVRQMGLLKVITGLATDGKSPLTDVLGGGAVDRSLDEALRDVSGIAVASTDTLNGLQRPGGGKLKVATVDDLRPGFQIDGARTTGPLGERDVASRLRLAPPVIEGGKADLDSIAREIRSRRRAIAACYERALKATPTLTGKLVVRFAITAAGTVSAVEIDDDTLGAPEVGACVRATVARWRFAPPAEAPVELSFPFVFQAAS